VNFVGIFNEARGENLISLHFFILFSFIIVVKINCKILLSYFKFILCD
jgi:hypothetical protein